MARVNVRVDYGAIQGMFYGSGEIGIWGQKVSQRARGFARLLVGKRTGRLANSITSNPAAGLLKYTISVGSNLEYSAWVNAGTTTPITPTKGTWLAVGKREGKKPVYRQYVLGQRAQHYLERGAEAALAAEGISLHFLTF